MAIDEHIAQLKEGAAAWNAWRHDNLDIRPDLRDADLNGANLGMANLCGAILDGANLSGADLTGADLRGAILMNARVRSAILCGVNFSGAMLDKADFIGANLSGANLSKASLTAANLGQANLGDADLSGANLRGVDLLSTDLSGANLREADLTAARMLETDLTGSDLSGCRVYGASTWDLILTGATKQQSLIITHPAEPKITVDNIEVAQFVHLLLHNQKIRDVIDTIGKKAVLILGRFTADRKAVLDAIHEELRRRDYLPILFDFDKPASRDLTATVSTLAHLARFIIADLTDPSSIPHELATVVPTTPVPVQPILLSGSNEFAMFQDLRRRHHWVLTTHRYDSQMQLIADLGEKVIHPAELKVLELRGSA
jgi:uncharacterized protein YjbI with pentapeptide repeats